MRYQSLLLLRRDDQGLPARTFFSSKMSAPTSPTSPTTPHHKRFPTGLGAEPLNIVVLGASFAGLSVAHFFLDNTVNRLRTTMQAPNYRLIIVSPSTHIYWNIGAPRALVAPGLISQDDAFIPIEPGFHRHRGAKFHLLQGEAQSLDVSARTVTVELFGLTAQKRAGNVLKRASVATTKSPVASMNPKVQTFPYHALIMATGTSAHSSLLSLHGPHLNTIGALNQFHAQIPGAKSIIICGGGPSGVETAGQLATYLNYSNTHSLPFVRSKIKQPKKIILISGSSRCLPHLKESVGRKAEQELLKLGVEIVHNLRVVAANEGFDLTGQTRVVLSNDTTITADLYVACTGVAPNTSYVPPALLNSASYIETNPDTMRVDAAGPRVFAVGDVASYSQNYVLDVYAAVPVVMHNLLNDLVAHELRLASPYGGNQDKIDAMWDAQFVQRAIDSQLCPITRFGGVGVLLGYRVPSFMVFLLKGRDYRVHKAKAVVVNGNNPYPS